MYFAVLADETTDVSRIEQMNICIRYVFEEKICEDYLTFLPVEDLTGKGLSQSILDTLRSYDLDLSKMVGQGYDEASAMSGQFKGVQMEVQKVCPTAAYVHCSSHCLNLSFSKASSVQARPCGIQWKPCRRS